MVDNHQLLVNLSFDRLEQLAQIGRLYTDKQAYIDRLNKELEVFRASGYSSLILITADFIRWARENSVVVGPGRGSAAGSLVVYLTGITCIDPIRFGLLFERFLNPQRISQPDIDTDFSDRDAVIQYIKTKYGKNRVAKVGVPSLFKPRSAIDEFARYMGIGFDETKAITRLIGDSKTFDEAFASEPDLAEHQKKYPELFALAKQAQGYVRQITTHPSAVILASGPIGAQIPLQRPPGKGEPGELITAWDGEELDSLGYVKLDILTVDNLAIINRTLSMLPGDDQIDFYDLPLDDELTLQGFENGETIGVFQFEEPKSVGILRSLPNITFRDVCAVNACIRPGLDVGQFISGRNNKDEIKYTIPELEPILGPTYGVILYQEQVMRMCVDIAGFSLPEADTVRKIIAKTANQSSADGLAPVREKFKKGYLDKGFDESKFDSLWSQILACQRYIFNSSHAVSYSWIAFADMYLKKHYPLQFMCSALQVRIKDIYIKECDRLGIAVMPPCVMQGQVDYAIVHNSIMIGLSSVKHVGAKAKVIVNRRPYVDEFDFYERVKPNDRQLAALVYSGALDCFCKPGVDRAILAACLVNGSKSRLPSFGDLAINERDALGFYLKYHPLGEYTEQLADVVTATSTSKATYAKVGGLITRVKLHQAKTGAMAFIGLLTHDGEIEAVMWPSDFASESQTLNVGNIISARGKRTDRGNYAINKVQVLKDNETNS